MYYVGGTFTDCVLVDQECSHRIRPRNLRRLVKAVSEQAWGSAALARTPAAGMCAVVVTSTCCRGSGSATPRAVLG
jgi:N-methylhydantoinase A/oxoprolinase/acetone carboxylase beta subunit